MRANKKTFHLIYLLNFLLALAWALPAYIESAYLQATAGPKAVALFLSAATLVTAVVVFFYPRLIRRVSNYRAMVPVLVANFVLLSALAFATHAGAIFFIFIAYYTTGTLLGINIDVFLEDISDDEHTGRIRTNLLMVANISWVLAPLVMGLLADGERYRLVFMAAATALLPALLLLALQRRSMRDRFAYRSRHFHQLLAAVWRDPNLVKIFSLALVLRFFYFIMVLYIPLHLHHALGFSWGTIGWILTVMLLPFLLLQFPAGRIADRFLGEKEIIITGLLTMIVFTGLIFFTRSTSPVVWAGILFMTRVGAALVEAMQEVYFFKHISRQDVDLINLFRDLGPVGWLGASLFSLTVLSFFTIPYLFLFLAVILMTALRPALTLVDTK
ncbi:MAG: Uncharacterized protein G01um101431_249 [Parcubacteria group bacterium Gr01-1014_31]|nr:MAG: Uncharacterized protein G01um101431_249 [Parcubacteria group bacterium Gr01-1014_31]